MENKKEKRQEKLKKTEKVISDPHREYLDMDTDEEGYERRGKRINFFLKICITSVLEKISSSFILYDKKKKNLSRKYLYFYIKL